MDYGATARSPKGTPSLTWQHQAGAPSTSGALDQRWRLRRRALSRRKRWWDLIGDGRNSFMVSLLLAEADERGSLASWARCVQCTGAPAGVVLAHRLAATTAGRARGLVHRGPSLSPHGGRTPKGHAPVQAGRATSRGGAGDFCGDSRASQNSAVEGKSCSDQINTASAPKRQ